jgi:tRNA/tmRNA/rRNA uracil-C5-methylase (TrmA/RlmC/RlmD family)
LLFFKNRLNLLIGVHSILASSVAKKVYAIDPLTLCIEDGKFNAKLNGCRDNIEWISGFAEAHLHRVLKKIGDLHGDKSQFVAIVNPSRYSLGKSI